MSDIYGFRARTHRLEGPDDCEGEEGADTELQVGFHRDSQECSIPRVVARGGDQDDRGGVDRNRATGCHRADLFV